MTHLIWFLAFFLSFFQSGTRIPGPGGSSAAAGTIAIRGTPTTTDSGTVATIGPLALPATANSGDLIIVGVPLGGNTTFSSVCDATTSAACGASLSTYSKIGGLVSCQGGSAPCLQVAYTCNAGAGAAFVTVVLGGADDENVVLIVAQHTVTSNCLDAHPTDFGAAGPGATLTSGAYSTVVANELAFYLFSDDNNNGPAWNGSAGAGFTLVSRAVAANSMLGVGQYQIYTSTQSSVTASINTGNSSANTVRAALVTFE